MLEIIVLALSTLVSAGIGLFVLARNPKHIINRTYAFLALLLTLFPVANYLSLHAASRLWYIRLVVLISVLAVAALYYLAVFMDDSTHKLSKLQRLGVACTIAVAGVSLTPFVFRSLGDTANAVPEPGAAIPLFFVQFVVFLLAACIALIKRIRRDRAQREQYMYMLAGIAPMLIFAPITAFIMPVLFHNVSLIFLSPVYAAFFVLLIGYAIVRHKLFDIRTFVLRAVAYVFSTVLLSVVFIVPAVLVVAAIIQVHFTWGRFVWGILGATVFALFYNWVRTAFDNLTNRIFFRGYYAPQDVLNQLSEVLVRSIDVVYIKLQGAKILQHAIKAERFGYWLVTDPDYRQHHPEMLVGLFRGSGVNVVLIDESLEARKAVEYLRGEDVAALVRLRAGSEILGFLVLGFKGSGAAYTERDKQLLNIAADEIAISLQNALHFEEIQNFNLTLQERIDTATHKLTQTNKKLRDLDETKDEFITMASHQLRTPLTAVKGYLSMVLEGDAGKLNAQQKKLLQQSFASSQRMVYLIADLLNLSRLGTGKFVIDARPTNLVEVVQTELDQLAQTAQSREVRLGFTHSPGFPVVMLDETKIHQVVMNLIDNAIYYTPPGGSVIVNLSETSGSVVFTVKDTGIGVPRSEQRHLFSKFYRAANARKARPDGTGLGLFMAKKVVAAQGGAIIFESEEGKGSTFGFRFSKSSHAIPASTPSVAPSS